MSAANLWHANAVQVVDHIARHVLGPGWVVTFGHFNTSRVRPRPAVPSDDPAWKMGWGGLFEEAQTGDHEAMLRRIITHTESVEADGREPVASERVEDWLSDKLSQLQATPNVSLLVCSRVVRRRDQAVRHIPMMDFRLTPSDRSLALVTNAMRMLGQADGVILESGQSYHYYGFHLLEEAEWLDFMYRSLLLTPFSDPRYIGHRLLAGTARLRVTATAGKPHVPCVVASL